MYIEISYFYDLTNKNNFRKTGDGVKKILLAI